MVGYIKLDPKSAPFQDLRLSIKLSAGQVEQVDLTLMTPILEKAIAMGQLRYATAAEYKEYTDTGAIINESDFKYPISGTPVNGGSYSDGFSDGFN